MENKEAGLASEFDSHTGRTFFHLFKCYETIQNIFILKQLLQEYNADNRET